MTGRSRWYSSFDPDRTASPASAAASRSSRPSPSPAGGRRARGPGPGVPQPLRAAPGGHQRVAGGPGLRDQVVGGPAERFRRVEQRGIGGEQDDPAVPAARADLLAAGVGPAQGLRPVQGQAQQARCDPGRRRGSPRWSGGGSAARTAPASSSTVATPPTSASALPGQSPRWCRAGRGTPGGRPIRPAGRPPAGLPGPGSRRAPRPARSGWRRGRGRGRARAAAGPWPAATRPAPSRRGPGAARPLLTGSGMACAVRSRAVRRPVPRPVTPGRTCPATAWPGP